jgi:hypothetical protein
MPNALELDSHHPRQGLVGQRTCHRIMDELLAWGGAPFEASSHPRCQLAPVRGL